MELCFYSGALYFCRKMGECDLFLKFFSFFAGFSLKLESKHKSNSLESPIIFLFKILFLFISFEQNMMDIK